jgi:radical SAM superfamily enzyme YgiQ (UPF0313 family)
MRILLINSPIRINAEPNCLPTGLAIIASVLRGNGHDVDIYDVNALRHSRDEVAAVLKTKKWDLAGVSGLITTFGFQEWVIRELKANRPEAPVISGGGFATSVPDIVLNHTMADIAVVGEGEETLPELCTVLSLKGDPEGVRGIAFRRNGKIVNTPPRPNVENLDDLPFPAWDLLPMEIYIKNPVWGNAANNSSGFKEGVDTSRSLNIITSRGCPYSCTYCYHLFGRSSYRYRSAPSILEEMDILIERYGVTFIGFNDDNTMASESRLLELCELIREKRWNLTWGCHGRVTNAKPHILRAMADAGCVWIGYGIESGSQDILNAMGKRATVEQAREAILNTRSAGIFPNTTFIFGYPGESLDTINETVRFKTDLNLNCGSFFATPYPGTVLYEQNRHLIGDEVSYIRSLGDATEFTVNLTHFPDDGVSRFKQFMDTNREVRDDGSGSGL